MHKKRLTPPPYHFNCRTTFRAVYDYELNKSVEVEDVPLDRVKRVFKPQEGFGGNPIEKESWWKINPAMIARADKYGITGDIVAQAREFDMQSYFPELLQGYELKYKSNTGGYVQMGVNAAQVDFEIDDAKKLADLGHKIYLLPATRKSKSPDMIIDNEIGEMKRFGFDTGEVTTNTVKTEIQDAGRKKRGRVVYVHVANNIPVSTVMGGIKSEIGRTPIQKILLDYRGVVKYYTRRFFINL